MDQSNDQDEQIKFIPELFELSIVYTNYLEEKKQEVYDSLQKGIFEFLASEKMNWPMKSTVIIIREEYFNSYLFKEGFPLFDKLKNELENIKESCLPKGYNEILEYMEKMNSSLLVIFETSAELEESLEGSVSQVSDEYIGDCITTIKDEITEMNQKFESLKSKIPENITVDSEYNKLSKNEKRKLKRNISEFNTSYQKMVNGETTNCEDYFEKVSYFKKRAEMIFDIFKVLYGEEKDRISAGTFLSKKQWYRILGIDEEECQKYDLDYIPFSLRGMAIDALKENNIKVKSHEPILND